MFIRIRRSNVSEIESKYNNSNKINKFKISPEQWRPFCLCPAYWYVTNDGNMLKRDIKLFLLSHYQSLFRSIYPYGLVKVLYELQVKLMFVWKLPGKGGLYYMYISDSHIIWMNANYPTSLRVDCSIGWLGAGVMDLSVDRSFRLVGSLFSSVSTIYLPEEL